MDSTVSLGRSHPRPCHVLKVGQQHSRRRRSLHTDQDASPPCEPTIARRATWLSEVFGLTGSCLALLLEYYRYEGIACCERVHHRRKAWGPASTRCFIKGERCN